MNTLQFDIESDAAAWHLIRNESRDHSSPVTAAAQGGTHQHLAVDIHLSVDDRGGLQLRSGAQRFYEGLIAFNFPLALSGIANVCEWFDDQKFHIEVNVHNDVWGPLFGYTGSFTAEWVTIKDGEIPIDLLPARYEGRE